MKTKRTPAPWSRNIKAGGKYPVIFAGEAPNHMHVAQVMGHGCLSPDEIEANNDRIVECVNACEGIDDVSIIPELLAAIKNLSKVILGKTAFLDLTPNDEAILNVALHLIDRAGGDK